MSFLLLLELWSAKFTIRMKSYSIFLYLFKHTYYAVILFRLWIISCFVIWRAYWLFLISNFTILNKVWKIQIYFVKPNSRRCFESEKKSINFWVLKKFIISWIIEWIDRSNYTFKLTRYWFWEWIRLLIVLINFTQRFESCSSLSLSSPNFLHILTHYPIYFVTFYLVTCSSAGFVTTVRSNLS